MELKERKNIKNSLPKYQKGADPLSILSSGIGFGQSLVNSYNLGFGANDIYGSAGK